MYNISCKVLKFLVKCNNSVYKYSYSDEMQTLLQYSSDEHSDFKIGKGTRLCWRKNTLVSKP